MGEILLLQHHAETGPSAFAAVLDAHAAVVPWRLVDLATGDPVPDRLDDVAAIVSMGGPMSATRPDEHAWMRPELTLLQRAVQADLPVFGVCLGSQLLGAALGGEVAARQVPRAAFAPLRRTPAGRAQGVAGGWTDGAPALLLHEDEVVRLPAGARPLLTGPADELAAWGRGSAVAVQAHPEVTADQLGRWVALEGLDTLVGRAGTDPAALLDEAVRREAASVPVGRALLRRWLDGPVRDVARARPPRTPRHRPEPSAPER
jgi:GMP synthase (glutamine-hydrolysing)